MTKGFGRFLRRNTIALLALFLVLGGTSYAAATAISGKSIKPNSIPRNRLTKTAIKQLKGNRGSRGPAGLRGPTGPQGVQGAQGVQGVQGAQGPAGTARAYALVNADGTLVPARSHNVVSVTHTASSGFYCVQLAAGVPATTTGSVGSAYYPTDGTFSTSFAHVEVGASCGTNGLGVYTFLVTASTNLSVASTDQPFFVSVP